MYYSPGVKYYCPHCNSDLVRFIFDKQVLDWSESMKLIKERKIRIVSFEKNISLNDFPKWICKECYDCGIIEKT